MIVLRNLQTPLVVQQRKKNIEHLTTHYLARYTAQLNKEMEARQLNREVRRP